MKNLLHTIQASILVLAVIFAQGCDSTSSVDSAQATAADLAVSVSDLYWGTRDVGVETTQTLILTNRGEQSVQINALSLAGADASEFSTSLHGAVTLKAGDMMEVAVSFAPRSEGRKYAALEIDYELI